MERSTISPERGRSALELLELEEERTLAALQGALMAAGEELCALDEVRTWVRRHPRLAVGTSTALGVLLAPLVASAARTALPLLLSRGSPAGSVARGLGRLARR